VASSTKVDGAHLVFGTPVVRLRAQLATSLRPSGHARLPRDQVHQHQAGGDQRRLVFCGGFNCSELRKRAVRKGRRPTDRGAPPAPASAARRPNIPQPSRTA
jgi:hypothetical protein